MAHTKQAGKARQHSQRPGKRLGVKIFGGQTVTTGQIIVRQRGTKFHSGNGTGLGKDFTIFAMKDGQVAFKSQLGRTVVMVV